MSHSGFEVAQPPQLGAPQRRRSRADIRATSPQAGLALAFSVLQVDTGVLHVRSLQSFVVQGTIPYLGRVYISPTLALRAVRQRVNGGSIPYLY